jgi:secondary thiamine-phosphate synthase enzyme
MAVHRTHFSVKTAARIQVRNITPSATEALRASPVRDGIACLSVRHTTCALAVNEDEAGLREDLERMAAGLLNPLRKAGSFLHDHVDDNAQAHLTSVLLSPSLTLSVSGGDLVLGTWQSVLLVELDGPRQRTVELTVVG